MRVNHVKESGAVRAEEEGSEENRWSWTVCLFQFPWRGDASLMTRNILYVGQLAGGVECQKSEREAEQQLEDVPTTTTDVNINDVYKWSTLHIWLRLKHSGSFDPAALSSSFSAYYYRSFARGNDNAHSFHSSIHEEGCAVKHGLFGELYMTYQCLGMV